MMKLTAAEILPDDADAAVLIGRVWIDGSHAGPRTFALRNGAVAEHVLGKEHRTPGSTFRTSRPSNCATETPC